MAERTFSENLIQIKGGVYGSDVRTAIHDAILQAYNHSDAGTASVSNGTIDSFISALGYALGFTTSKIYDSANQKYIYTVSYNGETVSGTSFTSINDNITASDSTWSSTKIQQKIQQIIDDLDILAEELSDL